VATCCRSRRGREMAALPIFNGDLLSSLLGVMAFPDDMKKAEAHACWLLALGGETETEKLIKDFGVTYAAKIMSGAAEFAFWHEDWERAKKAGNVAGAVTLAMVALLNDAPALASWERAILTVVDNYKEVKLSRSSVQSARKKYRKVYHFWAAWVDSEWTGWVDFEGDTVAAGIILSAKAAQFHATLVASGSAPEGEIFEFASLPAGDTFRDHTVPIDIVPQPGRPGRPAKTPS
jgi:hypothetical protein